MDKESWAMELTLTDEEGPALLTVWKEMIKNKAPCQYCLTAAHTIKCVELRRTVFTY